MARAEASQPKPSAKSRAPFPKSVTFSPVCEELFDPPAEHLHVAVRNETSGPPIHYRISQTRHITRDRRRSTGLRLEVRDAPALLSRT